MNYNDSRADWGSASSVASPPFTNVDFAQFDAFCSSSPMVVRYFIFHLNGWTRKVKTILECVEQDLCKF